MIDVGTNYGTKANRPVSRARHEQQRDSWMFPNVTRNSQPDSMRTGASCGSRTGFLTADFIADVDLDDVTNVKPVRASDLDVVNCTRIRISVNYWI